MPPLNEVEINLPASPMKEFQFLRMQSPRRQQQDNNSRGEIGEETPTSLDDSISLSSEISLDLLAKPHNHHGSQSDQVAAAGESSSSSIPEDLDYSLSVLLPTKEEEHEDDAENDGASSSSILDQSDYSLKVDLSKEKKASPFSNLNMSRSSMSLDFHNSRSTMASTETINRSAKKADKVKFNSRVHLKKVSNRKSLPKGELKARWYTRKEFKEIRQVCFDTLKLAKQNMPINEEEGFCVRGLEYKLKDAYKDRQANKANVRHLVFEEQDYQFDAGIFDPDMIAHISEDTSRFCVALAIEQGRIDAQEALEYLRS